VQPRTGFQVASVHSMDVPKDIMVSNRKGFVAEFWIRELSPKNQ